MTMEYSLGASEIVLTEMVGLAFEVNPITRLFSKIAKLWGKSTVVELVLTSKGVHALSTTKVLWSVVVGRQRFFAPFEHLSMVSGIQSSFLIVFKSYNLQFVLGGSPWIGISLKKCNFERLQAEVGGIALASTLAEKA